MIAYYTTSQFINELQAELKNQVATYGHLVLTEGELQKSVWAHNVWLNPVFVEFESISQAAKKLREMGPLWTYHPHEFHRRAQLIQDQLPKIKPRVVDFLAPLPPANLGAWTLLSPNKILASPTTTSPFAHGEVTFNENKELPPSRAYLKLWELMTVHGIKPQPGEKVIDFGSCPGGWTWVLQSVGCQVLSIDRSPLAPHIAALPGVEFMQTNAFSLRPQDLGQIDWFFSDIICYPPKLYELVENWITSGLCRNFVCTIKFQGETDFETLKRFQALPNCEVQHLYHNKHEVTVWIRTSSHS